MSHDPALTSQMDEPNLKIAREPRLLREEVVHRVRKAIIQGWYAPGARLIERELCEALGVSRTSVREALRQLESEQLVTVEPRRGPVVTEIPADVAQSIYELREVLEIATVRWFIQRATETQIATLRGHASDFRSAADAGDLGTLVESMQGFYQTLFAGSGNPALSAVAQQLMARISFLRARSMSEPGRVIHSIREIEAITSAVERRDTDSAVQAVTTHVRNAAHAAMRQLAEEPKDVPLRTAALPSA